MARTVEELEHDLSMALRKAEELKAWADAGEQDNDSLRTRIAELEGKLEAAEKAHASRATAQVAELQQWLDAAEAENGSLREEMGKLAPRLAELETLAAGSRTVVSTLDQERRVLAQEEAQLKELKAWLDAAEAESDTLRERVEAKEKLARDAEARLADLETEKVALESRVAEQEAAMAAVRDVNGRMLQRLEAELSRARQAGSPSQVKDLEATLSGVKEALATSEAERAAALEQARRYATTDHGSSSVVKKKASDALEALRDEKEAHIAVLTATLGRREEELRTLEARLMALARAETAAREAAEADRVRECEAREQLGHVRHERDELAAEKRSLESQLIKVGGQLQEAKAWMEASQRESEELGEKLEASRLEAAMARSELAHAQAGGQGAPGSPRPSRPSSPRPAEDRHDSLEGYTVERVKRLEAELAHHRERAERLQALALVAERSVAEVTRQLGAPGAPGVEPAVRELKALAAEVAQALRHAPPPPPPVDAVAEEDHVSEPLEAVEAMATAQADVARQATEALHGEQKARDLLLGDLSWLKAELEKLQNVRDELRTRIGAMVQRELRRKSVVQSLLDTLRRSEVASASRVSALRRLQAAIEHGQRSAVRVQTIYFQKQIGSLQRQLEAATRGAAPRRQTVAAPVRNLR